MNSVPEVPLGIVVVTSPSPPIQLTHVVDRGGGGVVSTPVCTPPHVDICSTTPPAALWLLGGKAGNRPILSLMTILLLMISALLLPQ